MVASTADNADAVDPGVDCGTGSEIVISHDEFRTCGSVLPTLDQTNASVDLCEGKAGF